MGSIESGVQSIMHVLSDLDTFQFTKGDADS